MYVLNIQNFTVFRIAIMKKYHNRFLYIRDTRVRQDFVSAFEEAPLEYLSILAVMKKQMQTLCEHVYMKEKGIKKSTQ